jgi:hypothetical protein
MHIVRYVNKRIKVNEKMIAKTNVKFGVWQFAYWKNI